MPAFHEAFADIVELFPHFTFPAHADWLAGRLTRSGGLDEDAPRVKFHGGSGADRADFTFTPA